MFLHAPRNTKISLTLTCTLHEPRKTARKFYLFTLAPEMQETSCALREWPTALMRYIPSVSRLFPYTAGTPDRGSAGTAGAIFFAHFRAGQYPTSSSALPCVLAKSDRGCSHISECEPYELTPAIQQAPSWTQENDSCQTFPLAPHFI